MYSHIIKYSGSYSYLAIMHIRTLDQVAIAATDDPPIDHTT